MKIYMDPQGLLHIQGTRHEIGTLRRMCGEALSSPVGGSEYGHLSVQTDAIIVQRSNEPNA